MDNGDTYERNVKETQETKDTGVLEDGERTQRTRVRFPHTTNC